MPAEDPTSPAWLTAELVAGVRAITTTRAGGVSVAPFDSFNLATHVGDAEAAVTNNRARLLADLRPQGCHAVQWLEQCHGSDCVAVAALPVEPPPQADAALTRSRGVGVAVLTADCLPVVLYRSDAAAVAVAHAGWRGLLAGVLASTVAAMPGPATQLAAWIGPAIGAARYEVGAEVRQAALQSNPAAEPAFSAAAKPGKFLFDLTAMARQVLRGLGVSKVTGGDVCCASDERFYSYRRDGQTGRMATIAWLDGAGAPNG